MLSGAILQSLGAFAIILASVWLGFNHSANSPLVLLLTGLVAIGIGWILT